MEKKREGEGSKEFWDGRFLAWDIQGDAREAAKVLVQEQKEQQQKHQEGMER